MAQHKAYDVPEHGTDRWKIARAKRAARLEDFEDDDDDLDRNDFLCPGDVIQYRIHPDPQWYFDTIVSTDPERDPFMVHCCNSKIHDDAMVGVIATKDNAGHFQPVAKDQQYVQELTRYLLEKAGESDMTFLDRDKLEIANIISHNESELHERLAASQAHEIERA
jgi:hypothetical protein